jgi:heme-degrading monooxygenase HmoA
MIARVFRGWTPVVDADNYEVHYRDEVVQTLQQVTGFRGAQLLRRTAGDEAEFVSVTLFDDLAAVRAFAGDNYELAVLADKARQLFNRYDEGVAHYEVVIDV